MAIRFRTQQNVNHYLQKQTQIRRVFAVSLSLGLVVLLGLIFWCVNIFIEDKELPAFVLYVPQEESSGPEQPQFRELHSNVRPADPTVNLIVADSTEDTSFMTDVEIDSEGLSMDGDALGGGMGDGDGLGEGFGQGGGSGMGSTEKVENAFVGRFWDMKKTPNGGPSKMKDATANRAVLSALSQFYNGGWNTSVFAPYCEAKTRLYSSCFYLPNCMDQEASNAYDPNGKLGLKPSRWVALYRAQVQAPKSGRFRFVGAADSLMAVRFNGRNVLSCGFHDLKTAAWNGLHALSNPDSLQGKEVTAYESCEFWNEQFGGFVGGEAFDVKAGEWYEMQVLISEIGGGNFGFCLLIDDVDEEGGATSEDGKPLYQLFRTSFISPTAAEVYEGIRFKDMELATDPPYDPDSMVWPAKPVKGGGRGK